MSEEMCLLKLTTFAMREAAYFDTSFGFGLYM